MFCLAIRMPSSLSALWMSIVVASERSAMKSAVHVSSSNFLATRPTGHDAFVPTLVSVMFLRRFKRFLSDAGVSFMMSPVFYNAIKPCVYIAVKHLFANTNLEGSQDLVTMRKMVVLSLVVISR